MIFSEDGRWSADRWVGFSMSVIVTGGVGMEGEAGGGSDKGSRREERSVNNQSGRQDQVGGDPCMDTGKGYHPKG